MDSRRIVLSLVSHSTNMASTRRKSVSLRPWPLQSRWPSYKRTNATWKWPNVFRVRYTTIRDGAIEARLEEVLDGYQASFAEPLIEGVHKSVWVTVYERNPVARQQCIAHYGTTCYVCGFSFGETYGKSADGYIHVHHLKALSGGGGKEHPVNPIKDLRPICPNCHAVIHRQTPPQSIVELKRMLTEARSLA
jgi:predicted HNH restriction endonuclease